MRRTRLLTILSWSIGGSLPSPSLFANADAAFEIVHNRAQVLDERSLFRLDLRHQPLVIGLAAAWRALWQGCEGSSVTTTQLAPEPLHAADAWRLLPEVTTCVVEPVASPASDRIQQVHMSAASAAPRAL